MKWKDWFTAVLALVLWREARGETHDGRVAIANVIRHRVLATHLDDAWEDVIQKKWQFSSLTAPGDATLVQWPKQPDAGFEDCMTIATATLGGDIVDNTDGATHYANLSVCDPTWAHTMTQTVKIGHHTFFK
jgi:N-acetylmuramoyl-L-alanine amidase